MLKELKKCNVTVGRFQPFTEGHMKMVEMGYKENGLPCVILQIPNTKNDAKHPFTDELIKEEIKFIMDEQKKSDHMSIAGHFYVKNADIAKIAQVCHENGFEPIMWLCGSDRYLQYSKQADTEKYKVANDMLMEFKAFEVKRTDDDTSATKVRQAIKDNDFTTYMKMMPQGFDENTPLWEKFKKELGQIKEGMMSFKDYIFENKKLQTLRDFINGKIEDDELNKLYDTYIKITGIEGKSTIDTLKKWIEEKMKNDENSDHIKTFKKSIFSLCEKYSCYESILKLANEQMNPNTEKQPFFNIDKLAKDEDIDISMENIIKYYNDKDNDNDYNIPEDFWKSLFKCEAASQPTIGKGEFLLRLISKNPTDKGGDVVINNKKIEVKNISKYEARIGNSKLGNSKPIFDFFNTVLAYIKDIEITEKFKDIDKIKPFSISKNNRLHTEQLDNIFKLLQYVIENKDDKQLNIQNKLKEILSNCYKKNFYYNDGDSLRHDYNSVFDKTIEALLKLTELTSYNLIKIFTLLSIRLYCGEEGADYLCLINKKQNFKFIKIDDNIFNIYNEDKEFPYYKIRYDNSDKKSVLIKF